MVQHCMQKEGREQRGEWIWEKWKCMVHLKRIGTMHLCLHLCLSEYHLKYGFQKNNKRAQQMYRTPPCTFALGNKVKSGWSSSALFPLIWPCDPDTRLNVSAAACDRALPPHGQHLSSPSPPRLIPLLPFAFRLSSANKTTWTREDGEEVRASHLSKRAAHWLGGGAEHVSKLL